MDSKHTRTQVWKPAISRSVELVTPVSEEEAEKVHAAAYGEGQNVHAIPDFFPYSFLYMARDPELAAAIATIAKRYLRPGGRASLGLKNLVAHVVSSVAGCRYCAVHQGYTAVNHGDVSAEKMADLWNFESSPLFDERERAALRFAVAAGSSPSDVNDDVSEGLREHFDEGEIFELVTVMCFFGFMNRWNDTFATPLEERMSAFGEEQLSDSGWDIGNHERQ